MMKIIQWPNTTLNARAEEITVFDDELNDIVTSMFDTMYECGGVGLAGNQVSILKRVLVVDTTVMPGGTLKKEFINPEVKDIYGKCISKEGCLSFPGVYVGIPRYERIAIEAQDRHGNTFSVIADGIDAICIQHEIDHLDGITFYDRLSSLKKKLHKKKFNKLKLEKTA